MNRWIKLAIVLGGYVLAFVAAGLAGYLYDRRMAEMPYDTSGGMYAAGEGMAWLGTFLVVALVPTLMGLWFMRRNTKFWTTIAVGGLGFAGVGLLSVLVMMTMHDTPTHLVGVAVELFGLAQLLGVPIWIAGFALFAFIAPTRPARRLLVWAVGIELVIGVCSVIRFLPAYLPL
jgi:hypothetical protein